MKTVFLLSFNLVILTVFSQDTFTIDAKKISETETPAVIIKSIASDFPDMETQAYYVLTGENIKSDWVITEEDNLAPGERVDNYSVLLKGKKGGYIHAYYNTAGELQMMKMLAVDFALPAAIQTAATSGKYAGYAIKSDKYVRIMNRKRGKEYVEVIVTKGSTTKKLYFTTDGKLVKEK